MKFIRKISLAKWTNSLQSDVDSYSADAITGCLRTSENTLSLWRCESEEDAKKSTLALLASQTRVDKLDIVELDFAELQSRNLSLVPSPGNTAAEVYADKHIDISNLNIDSLRLVAELVKEEVVNNRSKRITKVEFLKRLREGVENGEVVREALSKEVLAEIDKAQSGRAGG